MRYIRKIFLGLIAVALILVAVANKQIVTVQLEPFGLGEPFPQPIDVPLFLVIFASALSGMIAGFLIEWIRERKHRREIAVQQQKAGELRREVKRLAGKVAKTDKDALSPVPALRT